MEFYNKEDIIYALENLNRVLKKHNKYLDLEIVGGASILLNDIHNISTVDIDTSKRIEISVKEIIDNLTLDINDHSSDYEEIYRNLFFIEGEDLFSNITFKYLDIPDCIYAKLMHTNNDKMYSLIQILESININIDFDSINDYLISYDLLIDESYINSFVEFYNENKDFI